jgi:hypothetical protein
MNKNYTDMLGADFHTPSITIQEKQIYRKFFIATPILKNEHR